MKARGGEWSLRMLKGFENSHRYLEPGLEELGKLEAEMNLLASLEISQGFEEQASVVCLQIEYFVIKTLEGIINFIIYYILILTRLNA